MTAGDLGRIMQGLRAGYSPWTGVAVLKIIRGTFALAVRRGVLTRSPADGLARSETPKQRNARKVETLDPETLARLVGAAILERC